MRAVQHWKRGLEKAHPLKFSKFDWTRPRAACPTFECSPAWSRRLDWVTSKGPFQSKPSCGSVMNLWNIEQPDLIIALEKSMTRLQLKPVLFLPRPIKLETGQKKVITTIYNTKWFLNGERLRREHHRSYKIITVWPRNDWELGDTQQSERVAGLKWRGAYRP